MSEEWKDPNVELPPEGRYVLIHVPDRPWSDTDQEGVFYKVAYLYRCTPFGNNERPYRWLEFGPGSFFGQEVVAWREIPRRTI